MNENTNQQKALKKWNWGGFLLTPLWSIRHGVWFGLLSLIPLFGIFVSFIIGSKGNQKAWQKNKYESLNLFLKTQKLWSVAAVFIWGATVLFATGFFSYNLNYSEGMKKGLEIANSNHKLIQYFGRPIQKASFFQGSYNFEKDNKASTFILDFKAKGPLKTGYIHEEFVKKNGIWIASKISFKDDQDKLHPIIDSSPYIESQPEPSNENSKDVIGQTLEKITQNGDGFIVFVRSDLYNDFIQASTVKSENNQTAFFIEYNEGSIPTEKNIFRSKQLYSKEQVDMFFKNYASGSDELIDLIEWQETSL